MRTRTDTNAVNVNRQPTTAVLGVENLGQQPTTETYISRCVENGELRGACKLHSLMACVAPKDYEM
jgi:hypothetical protein